MKQCYLLFGMILLQHVGGIARSNELPMSHAEVVSKNPKLSRSKQLDYAITVVTDQISSKTVQRISCHRSRAIASLDISPRMIVPSWSTRAIAATLCRISIPMIKIKITSVIWFGCKEGD